MNAMTLVRSSMPSSGKDFSNIFIYIVKSWLYICIYDTCSTMVTLNLALANLEQEVGLCNT